MAHSRHHGTGFLRGIDHVPCSTFHAPQRFGRLFPNLPGLVNDRDDLLKLANGMRENRNTASGNSPTTPAGFTFLGQFIDHDITLDTTSSLERQNDPAATRNFRTPLLELDSVYGMGPEASPFLYDQDKEGRLLTGFADNPEDLPRNSQGVALIGDPRNDENGIISQLHLAFLKFHNAVYELVEKGRTKCERYHDDDFREAQRLVRWHYQWIIVHEFLPLIIDAKVLASIWKDGLRCYKWGIEPFMPVEFAVAAYRFGHSQVRSRYQVNNDSGRRDLFKPPANALSSFEPVPEDLVVDWRHFFKISNRKPQPSRLIDTKLTKEVFKLPFLPEAGGQNSLAFRNLLRGQSFALPSGENVACALGVDPLPPGRLGPDAASLGGTPLWFYILREAELNPKDRLGEVGGRIVGEVFVGMLKGDSQSYLSVAKCWKPCLPSAKPGTFTMADLLKLAAKA